MRPETPEDGSRAFDHLPSMVRGLGRPEQNLRDIRGKAASPAIHDDRLDVGGIGRTRGRSNPCATKRLRTDLPNRRPSPVR